MSTQKPSKKSGNCRCSGGPPAEWFWEVILCLPDTAVRTESAKKTPPFGWCFGSGRRGSNSLPGIPRMAVAIRRSPASPLDLTCFAQVEAATSSLPAVSFQKRKSHPDGWDFLFWSGRRGSNSLPRPWQGRALPDELRPHMTPIFQRHGASGRSRTNDTRIFSPLLYQLSYRGKYGDQEGARTLDLQRDRLAF